MSIKELKRQLLNIESEIEQKEKQLDDHFNPLNVIEKTHVKQDVDVLKKERKRLKGEITKLETKIKTQKYPERIKDAQAKYENSLEKISQLIEGDQQTLLKRLKEMIPELEEQRRDIIDLRQEYESVAGQTGTAFTPKAYNYLDLIEDKLDDYRLLSTDVREAI